MPAEVKDAITKWANYSKADATWSNYRTAERMLCKCQKDEKVKFDWPMTTDDTYRFVYWMVEKRGLRTSTVNNYLSGIRNAHMTRGLTPPLMRDEFLKSVIKGRAAMEVAKDRTETSRKRLPMTIPLMKLLKERIRTSEYELETRLCMWAICTLMFYGAFRVHEVLRNANQHLTQTIPCSQKICLYKGHQVGE